VHEWHKSTKQISRLIYIYIFIFKHMEMDCRGSGGLARRCRPPGSSHAPLASSPERFGGDFYMKSGDVHSIYFTSEICISSILSRGLGPIKPSQIARGLPRSAPLRRGSGEAERDSTLRANRENRGELSLSARRGEMDSHRAERDTSLSAPDHGCRRLSMGRGGG
jgi:hypothetical protein